MSDSKDLFVAPTPVDWDLLFDAARAARERAYAPYSRFQVGAALLTDDGTVVPGCNVENRSFGLCICAERTAVSSAVAAGHRGFKAVAVVTDTTPPAVPCGMCRETLQELGGGDLAVGVANLEGDRRLYRLDDLFPAPFEWPPELDAPADGSQS
ncbi:MAG: cytidine deaminase [Acidobacteriota bacterium]